MRADRSKKECHPGVWARHFFQSVVSGTIDIMKLKTGNFNLSLLTG